MMPALPKDWVWNGYYLRDLNSPALRFFGKVAIRVAYDKENGVHHAFIPAFIIPHLKITTFDLEFLCLKFIETCSVSGPLESYGHELPEYFDLAVSTFYYLLSWACKRLRLDLGVPLESNTLAALRPVFNGQLLAKLLNNLYTTGPPS